MGASKTLMKANNNQMKMKNYTYTQRNCYVEMCKTCVACCCMLRAGVKWNDKIIINSLGGKVVECWKHQHTIIINRFASAAATAAHLHTSNEKKNKVIKFSEMNMKTVEFNWTCRKIGRHQFSCTRAGKWKANEPAAEVAGCEKWQMVNCLISRGHWP